MQKVEGTYLNSEYLFMSNGDPKATTNGVRAVVTLSSDVQLTGSSEAGWSY